MPPVQHARRKVLIESKAAIKEAIDYMVKQDILEPQIKPTPWVSSVTYPVKRRILMSWKQYIVILLECHGTLALDGTCSSSVMFPHVSGHCSFSWCLLYQ